MSRVHDMGGRYGDGPVHPTPESDPMISQDWHGRALALTLASGALGQWNIDISRHARERLSPQDYSRFSYYEKWISALADLLVEKGVLTIEDLKGQGRDSPHPLADKKLTADRVAAMLAAGGPSDRASDVPQQFNIGQRVRTRQLAGNAFVDGGHTRLPTYAAGRVGTVTLAHGAHVLPDASAHGLGERPEPLYSVTFRAADLWSNPENPADEVVLDLWQSYLEPA